MEYVQNIVFRVLNNILNILQAHLFKFCIIVL